MQTRKLAATTTAITVEAVAALGVPVTKELADYVTRCAYLAKRRPSEEEQKKYESWVLDRIRTYLESGTLPMVNWKSEPVTMGRTLTSSQPTPKVVEPAHPTPTALIHPLDSFRRRLPEIIADALKQSPLQFHGSVLRAVKIVEAKVDAGLLQPSAVDALVLLMEAKVPRLAPPLPNIQIQARQQELPRVNTARLSKRPREESSSSDDLFSSSSSDVEQTRPKIKGIKTTTGGSHSSKLVTVLSDWGTRSSLSKGSFIGTSTELERSYSRNEPSMEDIRSEAVLQKALRFIKEKANKDFPDKLDGLRYLSAQLRGMRQDLKVQRLRTPFAVGIYEMHCELAIELGDVAELLQCQIALKHFYSAGHFSKIGPSAIPRLICQRLIYLACANQLSALQEELSEVYRSGTSNSSHPMSSSTSYGVLLNSLSQTDGSQSAVENTIRLCEAIVAGDGLQCAREVLFSDLDRSSVTLFLHFLRRLRLNWLGRVAAALKNSLPLHFILQQLGFCPIRGRWLDGTEVKAEEELFQVFQMMKLSFPKGFSFRLDSHSSRKGLFIDGAELRERVTSYFNELNTRDDARHAMAAKAQSKVE